MAIQALTARSLAGKRLQFRRIDGGSALEDRERAIQDFNAPHSDVFIFLLSIRAAGRGLNLQARAASAPVPAHAAAQAPLVLDPDAASHMYPPACCNP